MSGSEEATKESGFAQLSLEFGSEQLRAIKNVLEIDPGGVAFKPRKDDFTVATVGRAKTAATSVTFDTDDFESYKREMGGKAAVSGKAFQGVMAAIFQIRDRNSRTYELSVDGDTVSLRETERGIGGSIPIGTYAHEPTVSDFEDELTAEASVASPAAVRPLYRKAKTEKDGGVAELAAANGTAKLTFSGKENVYADLGEASHDGQTATIWNGERIRDAFLAFEHVNKETTVTWGEDYPVILRMDDGDTSYQAIVAPRIPTDDRRPLYEKADEVQSVDVMTAGGFK